MTHTIITERLRSTKGTKRYNASRIELPPSHSNNTPINPPNTAPAIGTAVAIARASLLVDVPVAALSLLSLAILLVSTMLLVLVIVIDTDELVTLNNPTVSPFATNPPDAAVTIPFPTNAPAPPGVSVWPATWM